jgi:tetratricopeptide (TPR) repeat protein
VTKLRFIIISLFIFGILSEKIYAYQEQSNFKIGKPSASEIITEIKEQLKQNPDDLKMIGHWAFVAGYYGLWEESIEANTRLIELGDKDPTTYNNLGRAYMNLDNLTEAEKYLKKSLELQPDNFFAFHNLGLLFQFKKEFNTSIQYLKKALEISSNWPQTHYDLGNTYLGIKDYERAIQCYKKSIELGQNNADIYKKLGIAYLGKDDKDQALNYFNKALNLSPEDEALKGLFLISQDALGSLRGEHYTDKQLQTLAIQKDIIPQEPDEDYIQKAIQQKETIILWLIMDREDKITMIDGLKERYRQNGITVRYPSSYYVDEINGVIYKSIIKGDKDTVLRKGIGTCFKTIAIMDGDYNDGRDKIEIFIDYLGEEMLEIYKQMYPDKYKRLLKQFD